MCVLIPGFARSVHCSAVYTRAQGSLVHWCRVGAREYLLAGRDAAQSRRGGLKAHRGHERSHVRSPSYHRPWSDLVGLTYYRPWYRTSPARIAPVQLIWSQSIQPWGIDWRRPGLRVQDVSAKDALSSSGMWGLGDFWDPSEENWFIGCKVK